MIRLLTKKRNFIIFGGLYLEFAAFCGFACDILDHPRYMEYLICVVTTLFTYKKCINMYTTFEPLNATNNATKNIINVISIILTLILSIRTINESETINLMDYVALFSIFVLAYFCIILFNMFSNFVTYTIINGVDEQTEKSLNIFESNFKNLLIRISILGFLYFVVTLKISQVFPLLSSLIFIILIFKTRVSHLKLLIKKSY